MSEAVLESADSKLLDEVDDSAWKVYPAYKNSGVNWLGNIPEHWKVKKLKYAVQLLNEKVESTDTDLEYIGLENIESWTGRKIETESQAEGVTNRFGVEDVLFGKLRPYLAKVFHAQTNGGLCTSEALVLRKKDLLPRYLFYYLLSKDFIEIVDSSTYGAKMPRANWSFIGNLPILLPGDEEQFSIVSFLDREIARIDALIARKQRLIKLLQEKRTALISQTTTKGLAPNVTMKDSGVEWLGNIPAHWGTCKLKRIATVSYGVGGELDRSLTEGTRIFSLPNINIDGELLCDDIPFVELTESEKKEALLKKGDLLFNWRNGSSDHLGKTAYFDLDGEYTHVSFLLKIRFFKGSFDPRFFQKLINGLRITGFFSTSKAGVNNTFNMQELQNLDVIVPPPSEQHAISEVLDRETRRIDTLIKEISLSIQKSKVMRSALISATVTGKIDVREIGA